MKTPDRRTSYLVPTSSKGSKPLMVGITFSFFRFFSTFEVRSLQLSFRWGNNEWVNSDASSHSSTMYIVRLCHQINETMTSEQSGIMQDNETHMAHAHTHTRGLYISLTPGCRGILFSSSSVSFPQCYISWVNSS